jgi:hypothetical protein
MNLLKVVVRVKDWVFGRGNLRSALRCADTGLKCCIGFVGQTLGATDEQLTGYSSPLHFQVAHKSSNIDWGLLLSPNDNTPICLQLMEVNDRITLSLPARKRLIKKLGRQAGIDFNFVGRL